jgi:hypothetical protein
LGIEGKEQGDQVTVEVPGVGTLRGELDFRNEWFAGIRTADSMYRFFGRNHFGMVVGMTVHDFSGHGDPAATAETWGAYLEQVYA